MHHVIVVHGAKLTPSGQASPALRRRVLCGVRLWKARPDAVLILTGGRLPPSRRAEAQVAAMIARADGVPDSALRLDMDSRTTRENLQAAARIAPDFPIVLVTDAWHVPRALWLARRLGIAATGVSSGWGPMHRLPVVLLREGGAWIKAIITAP